MVSLLFYGLQQIVSQQEAGRHESRGVPMIFSFIDFSDYSLNYFVYRHKTSKGSAGRMTGAFGIENYFVDWITTVPGRGLDTST
jgi:hypothetical protein